MIPPTPKPIYPNVPVAPGVPPVLRAASQAQVGIVSLVSDALAIVGLFQAPMWGIFTTDGQPILTATSPIQQFATSILGAASSVASLFGVSLGNGGFQVSVADMEYRRDYRIATAPQEQGAFTSYNKAQMPFDGHMTFIISGTQSQRASFFSQIEQFVASLGLVTMVMPEGASAPCNVIHYGFRRSADHGVSMVAVDIWLEQVRVVGTTQFSNSNTGSASGSDAQNIGAVTPLSPNDVSGGNGGSPVSPFVPTGAPT